MSNPIDRTKPVCPRCLGSGREPSSGHQTVKGWQDSEPCYRCSDTGVEPTNTDAALEKILHQAYIDARSDIDGDHPEGVHALDVTKAAIQAYAATRVAEALERILPKGEIWPYKTIGERELIEKFSNRVRAQLTPPNYKEK